MKRYTGIIANTVIIILTLSFIFVFPSASSDFYENEHNNENYMCRSALTTGYGKSKIEYSDSTVLLTSELTITWRFNGSYTQYVAPMVCEIDYSVAEVEAYGGSAITFCSSIHSYKIGSSYVYFVGLIP